MTNLRITCSFFLMVLLCGCIHNLNDSALVADEKSPDAVSRENSNASYCQFDYQNDDPMFFPNITQADSSVPDNSTEEVDPMEGTESEGEDSEKGSDLTKKTQSILDEALDLCRVSQDYWQKGELEKAIEALDQAYSLILEVDVNDRSKFIQQKEDLRFMISKRILEIYASRHIVVNGNHNAIPLVINKHVQSEIDSFTKGNEKEFFIESYKRSGKYRARMAEELKQAGLPVELSWLPLIESGFKAKALSSARALGLWQFIPSTGYKFGLKRDTFIDERLDPEKSTRAAIDYLKELHQMFGDWSTVLAAYNCGEGKVLRVIRDQNVNYLDNFWDLYERLPRETARYVPRFLATLHIVGCPEKYGLDQIDICPPIVYETVIVSKQIHFKDISRKTGISELLLKELNPELRYNILPNDKYVLKIPSGNQDLLLANLDEIPVVSTPRPAFVNHRVRSGETLSSIAMRYRTSVQNIARANNLHRKNYIVTGKVLKIPAKGGISYPPLPSEKTDPKMCKNDGKHIVKSGDSLWNIAKRYGTTTQKICGVNNLSSTNLTIGQILKIPGCENEKPVPSGSKTYRVKRGDSPFKIAQQYNMSLEQLLNLNNLTQNSKIYPGQKLYTE
ncbi:MAG TPA: LysM peptidoglycan-binding domain-containing protein [Desulfobacterales bacterium]|nr:LysM peptidoglycan-binding domain-containing protein [Desulfobacterales bacterium]